MQPTDQPKDESEPTKEVFYEHGLSGALEIARCAYEDNKEDYQELLSQEDRDLIEGVRGTMNALMNATGDVPTFNISARYHKLRVEHLVGHLGKARSRDSLVRGMKAFSEAVEERLAYHALEMLDIAMERKSDVLESGYALHPSRRGAAFLQRVSRCYLFGFDPECVVMCRSLLDAEFEAEISTDDCIGVMGKRGRHVRNGLPLFDLNDRIAVAARIGRLDAIDAEKAYEVKSVGNTVVHRNPKTEIDALDVIRKSLDVVEALSRSQGKGCGADTSSTIGGKKK